MVQFIAKKIESFAGDKKGVTMLEYGLLAALIAVAAVATLQGLSSSINAEFSSISATLK
jgi:pilus assembly protein Flp/PilA